MCARDAVKCLNKPYLFKYLLITIYTMSLNILLLNSSSRGIIGGDICETCKIGGHRARMVHSESIVLDELGKAHYDIVMIDGVLDEYGRGPDPREVAGRVKAANPEVAVHLLEGGIEDPEVGHGHVDWVIPKRQHWIQYIFGQGYETGKPLNTAPSQHLA